MEPSAIITIVLLFSAAVAAAMLVRPRKSKPPEVLKGFAQMPEYELKARGLERGLSAETQTRLLGLFSIGPAEHLALSQERERYYEEMRTWKS